MKTNLLFITLSIILLSACSNDFEFETLTNTEKDKIDRLTKLYEQYGWTVDESSSESERIKFLLESDEEEFKYIITAFSSTHPTSRAEISNMPVKNYTVGKYAACAVFGKHDFEFGTSTTVMEIVYTNGYSAYVNKSRADISPKAKWYPNLNHELFKWKGNICQPSVEGIVKFGSFKRNLTMVAYIEYDPNSNSISRGFVKHFH